MAILLSLSLIMVVALGISFWAQKTTQQSGLVIIGKAPSFSFTDQNGKQISNETYKGKVYVADFFFTTCKTICPVMTTHMVQVQNAFPNHSIGIASFSIDPETDTPQVLKEYAQKMGIISPNWHLLWGEEDAIYRLANEGFNLYAKKLEGENSDGFEHSGLFALIDPNGNIVSRMGENGAPLVYYQGTDMAQVQMLIEDIKKLQN